MTRLMRFLAPGLVAAGLAGPAAAQTTSVDTSGTTTTGSSLGGSSLGGSSSLGGTNGSAFGTGNTSFANPVTISPPSQVQTTNAMAPSNQFGRYYANPLFQGATAPGSISSGTSTIVNPGGFNAPTYGNTSTGGGTSRTGGSTSASTGFTGSTGTAGRTTGATGTTGFGAATTGSTTGFGNTAGRTNALGGTNSLNGGGVNQQNTGLISPRAINYTATYRFPVAVTPPAQMTTQLRGILDASTMIANPKNVQVVTEPGGLVTLRGTVTDDEEARTVEGMLRLTPGVRDVKNELTYPGSPVPVATN